MYKVITRDYAVSVHLQGILIQIKLSFLSKYMHNEEEYIKH